MTDECAAATMRPDLAVEPSGRPAKCYYPLGCDQPVRGREILTSSQGDAMHVYSCGQHAWPSFIHDPYAGLLSGATPEDRENVLAALASYADGLRRLGSDRFEAVDGLFRRLSEFGRA